MTRTRPKDRLPTGALLVDRDGNERRVDWGGWLRYHLPSNEADAEIVFICDGMATAERDGEVLWVCPEESRKEGLRARIAEAGDQQRRETMRRVLDRIAGPKPGEPCPCCGKP